MLPFKMFSRYVAPASMKQQKYTRCFSTLNANLQVAERHRELRESNVQARLNFSQAFKAAHMFNLGDSPLSDVTIGQLLGEAAATWPERTCIVSLEQNLRVTFSDLLRRVDAFAAGLKKLGMRKGDRLGIWGPNDLEWLITSLATSRIGMICVAINSAYQHDELVYSLRKVGAKAVVSPDGFKRQNYPKLLLAAKEECPSLEHIVIYSQDHVTGTRRFTDVEALATRTEVSAIAAEQSEISCYDGCNIQFTSGSTGRAKATLLSHKSVVNNSRESMRRMYVNTECKVCLNVPLFHAFGLLMGQLFMLHGGNTLILQGRSFNPVKSLEAIAKEKCNVIYGTPTMWTNLVDVQERLRLLTGSIQTGVIGGAPASPQLFRHIRDTLGVDNMTTLYGLTESTGVVFEAMPNGDVSLVQNTVGHLANHVEAMVVNEAGSPVPYGTPGELWIRGYCNMMGYWNDEENTRKILTQDGWLKTGDQFILREDGYGIIIGRFKDMIIRGGENIFPKEIEDFLLTHPKVLEAQVIGAYDEIYGEEICACVTFRDGAEVTKNELRNYCENKIADFKIPRYIEFVDEYPKTISGKIQKFRLREQLESRGVIPAKPKHS